MEPAQSQLSIVYRTVYAIVIFSLSCLANAQESNNQKAVNPENAEKKQTAPAVLSVDGSQSKSVQSRPVQSKTEKPKSAQSKPAQMVHSPSPNNKKANASAIESKIQNLIKQNKRKFEYAEAAKYTHLKWSERINKYSVGLLPIQNYSGVPIEERDESPDYYDHGKLPIEINHLFYDLLATSRQFNIDQIKPDYWLQFSIEEYHLPFPYAANDKWWKTSRDTVDRAFISAKPATVKLSLKVIAGDRPFKQWRDAAMMTISSCDLNVTPQTLSSVNNQNQTLKDYLTTTPGQAILSASNFLIMHATKRLAEEGDYAYVEKIVGDEIHLWRENSHFKVGETLQVYYSDQSPDSSPFSKKQIKVIKAAPGFAIAYPVSIRADHLKVGDFVKTNSRPRFESPGFRFTSTGQCAEVIVAQAD